MNTVLVATERDLEQNLLKQVLDGQGYQIIRSRDGLDAIESARSMGPQVLLVNVALPKLDGFSLYRRFQQDEQLRQIPIVLFSTRSNDQKSERFAQELGARHFVANALKPGALDGVLDNALATNNVVPLPAFIAAKPASPVRVVTESAAALASGDKSGVDATVKLQTLPTVPEADQSQLQQLQAEQAQLRQALQALQQQSDGAQTWQSLFALSPVAVWVVARNTQKMLAVNEAALRLFAYSHGEFMQLDSPAMLRDPGQANTTNVFAFRSKDGRALSLLVNTRELTFKTQAAELWVAHDVSYRVRGERAMADEVQRVKAILANLPIAYLVIDHDAQLNDVNANACRLLGYSRQQLLERGLLALLRDAPAPGALQSLREGEQLALTARHSDGHFIDIKLTAGQAEFGAGLRLLMLHVDAHSDTVELPVALPEPTSKLSAVLEMLRYAEDADEATLLQYAMAQVAHAFNSPLALFAAAERITQTLDICATSSGVNKRRAMTSAGVAVPLAWHDLLKRPAVLASQTPDTDLMVEGMPEISSHIACSATYGRDLWLLVVANRETAYSSAEQAEVQECANILVSLLNNIRQRARLQAQSTRSAAAADSILNMVERLLDQHDVYAAEGGARVARLAGSIAQQLELSPERQAALMLAARLHDIGHLLLPQALLLNPKPLSAVEQALMRTHVERGVQLLNGIDLGADVASIVEQHHERLDGSGYPAALSGDQISIEARILAVADVVEAMCSARAHRPACGVQQALAEMRAGAGRTYDAQVVAACERVLAQNEGLLL